MNQKELRSKWSEVLRKGEPTTADFDGLVDAVISTYARDIDGFRQHMKNRFGRVTETTGQAFDPDSFDQAMARAFIADEVGFVSWEALIERVSYPRSDDYPMLFQFAIAALWRGDFTALNETIGADRFDFQIQEWIDEGLYANEPETMAESFAAACMLGHEKAAAGLLDAGVDPYAGMGTGLAGFHYATSSGRLNVVKLLIERKTPMEVENMYGGTVLGQALWSAVHEHTDRHAEIVELLINAGAYLWPETLAWWKEQDVPSSETKTRIAKALKDASS